MTAILTASACGLALTGCGSSAAPSPTPTASGSVSTGATVTTEAAPTPSPTPPITGVTVVATGAAASATGTLAFVVVNNTTASATGAVQITVVAKSSNGHAPVQGSAVIPNVGVGESQAAVVALTIPSGDSIGALTATSRTNGTAAYVNPLASTGARFVNDPINPTVSVSVIASSSVRSATIVAVCWKGTVVVGGGMKQGVAVASGGAQSISVPAALTAAPSSCTGYARPG